MSARPPGLVADVFDAAAQTLSPPFRSILWRALGLTLLLLALVAFGLDRLLFFGLVSLSGWIGLSASILAGVGLLFGAAYLIAPICAVVLGFYADPLAELVERAIAPARVGRPLPIGRALLVSLRFTGLALVVNALALCLLFLPGVNLVAFLAANAYLLGRVTFEFAAMRHRSPREAVALYKRNAGYVFLCGLWIALLLSIPVLNLLTPLFAVALMVRVCARCGGFERIGS